MLEANAVPIPLALVLANVLVKLKASLLLPTSLVLRLMWLVLRTAPFIVINHCHGGASNHARMMKDGMTRGGPIWVRPASGEHPYQW